jgi:hypothetical protein
MEGDKKLLFADFRIAAELGGVKDIFVPIFGE